MEILKYCSIFATNRSNKDAVCTQKNKIKQERRPKKEKTVPTRTVRKPLSLSRSSWRRIYEICCMLLYITFEAKQGDQPAETFQATVFSGSTRDRERF